MTYSIPCAHVALIRRRTTFGAEDEWECARCGDRFVVKKVERQQKTISPPGSGLDGLLADIERTDG